MKIAVLDDESEAREKMTGYLRRFEREMQLELDIEEYSDPEVLIEGYRAVYDIIFFDVEMAGMNGIEAAHRIRELDKSVAILFVTQMAQYAIRGYEVDAVDYLLKPLGYDEFALKMQKTLRYVAARPDRSIVMNTAEGSRRVSLSSILYAEVIAHYLVFHTTDREYKIRGNMKDCEAELSPYGFTRIHRAYLVNLAHIDTILGTDVLVGDASLPVGGMYRDKLMQDFLSFARR